MAVRAWFREHSIKHHVLVPIWTRIPEKRRWSIVSLLNRSDRFCWCGLVDLRAKLHAYTIPVTPKSLQETLCVAEFALQELGRQHPGYNAGGDIESHLEKVRELIKECQRKRPTGPGGKHGDLHTDECGCER